MKAFVNSSHHNKIVYGSILSKFADNKSTMPMSFQRVHTFRKTRGKLKKMLDMGIFFLFSQKICKNLYKSISSFVERVHLSWSDFQRTKYLIHSQIFKYSTLYNVPYYFILPQNKNFSMMKAFADDKIMTQKLIFLFGRVENIVGKKKMLVTSIFFLSHNVFKRYRSYGRYNSGLGGRHLSYSFT